MGSCQAFPSGTPNADNLLAVGMAYVAWDGVQTQPILDKDGRLFVLLAGSSRDQISWECVRKDMVQVFEVGQKSIKLSHKQEHNHQGDFPAIIEGIYFSGGAKVRFEPLPFPETWLDPIRLLETCAF